MLQRILNAAGLQPRVCAQLLGVNPELFCEWVSGSSRIPESFLRLLSAVLGVSPELLVSKRLIGNEADLTPQVWYKFRGEKLTDADRDFVVLIRQVGHFMNELETVTQQKAVLWVTLFDAIRKGIDIQAPPREQGKAAARILRQSSPLSHGLRGVGEILRGILRSWGILMVETPIVESHIEGCSFIVGAINSPRPCVFANTHHTTWFRRNALLVHEVAHAIFEPFNGASLDFFDRHETDVEVRADAFAQETLIPKEVLAHVGQAMGLKWHNLTAEALARLVADTHVEQRLLISAAIDAGFVEPQRREELERTHIWPYLHATSPHALTTEEYLERVGAESEEWVGKRTTTLPARTLRLPIGYVTSVVDAQRAREISIGKASEYLMVDSDEYVRRFGANEELVGA